MELLLAATAAAHRIMPEVAGAGPQPSILSLTKSPPAGLSPQSG